MKAVFHITLIHPPGTVALSNGKETGGAKFFLNSEQNVGLPGGAGLKYYTAASRQGRVSPFSFNFLLPVLCSVLKHLQVQPCLGLILSQNQL